LFEERFVGNQINPPKMFSAFSILARIKQCKHGEGPQGPEIDWVGAVFRGLEIKNPRKRDIGAPVENQSECAFLIVANSRPLSAKSGAEAAARTSNFQHPNLGFLN